MKASRFCIRLLSSFGPLGAIALAAFVSVVSVGCNQGAEGDRCNPDLSHDECGSGLSCQQPAECPENYCCPVTASSANPNCQPGCTPGGVAALCSSDPTAAACLDTGAPDAGGGDSGMPTADTGADSGATDTGTKG